MTGHIFLDHDRYRDVKWAHILGDMGRYHPKYRAISGDIGEISGDIRQYQAISEDILVISSSVKFFMYWARPIQVVPGQLFFLVIFVWPCRILYC